MIVQLVWVSVTVFVDWDLRTGVNEKKEAGDPSLKWNKGTLFAEMHACISSIKDYSAIKKNEIPPVATK